MSPDTDHSDETPHRPGPGEIAEHSSWDRQAAWRGFKAVAPLLPGFLPFAMIAGSSAVEVGIPALPALAMSVILFAGASQLVLLEMWGREAPALVILATVWLVNLRFVMYSATLAPHLRHMKWIQKLPLAYLLTDQATLISLPEFEKNSSSARWFFTSAALTLWFFWQTGTAIGVFLGVSLPESWSLDFAVPLSFLALLIPAIRGRVTAIVAFTAGSTVLITRFLPLNLGLIVAVVVGVGAGLLSERFS